VTCETEIVTQPCLLKQDLQLEV